MTLRFGNMVRETSTTTGTGTYSLAGASAGYNGFVAAGFGGEVVVYRAQTGNDWEIGLGTITDAAPDTLARTEILETLVSGTYDNTSPAAVNWTAGTRTIDLIGPAQAITGDTGYFLPHPGQQIDNYYYKLFAGSASRTIPTNIQMFQPHYHARYSKMAANLAVLSAEAGKLIDVGLYDIKNGFPNALLESSTGISLTSTGDKTTTTSSLYKPGWYAWSYLSDATTAAARGSGSAEPIMVLAGWGVVDQNQDYPRNFGQTRTYASGLINPFSGGLANANFDTKPGFWIRPVS